MDVEPWQQDLFDELFLVYDDGERVYHEALVGIARKNGKSTMASVLGLYGLLAADHPRPGDLRRRRLTRPGPHRL
jgi:phage terminase large subunit-like protein